MIIYISLFVFIYTFYLFVLKFKMTRPSTALDTTPFPTNPAVTTKATHHPTTASTQLTTVLKGIFTTISTLRIHD